MILTALIAMTLQSSELTATCSVAFTINRTYADDIAVACNATEDNAGAEAEALRQVSWERDFSDHLIQRNRERIETTLTLYGDRTESGIDWWGYAQPLVRHQPNYSISGYFATASASCIVTYNLRNGFSRVIDSTCNAREQPDSFGRQARNTIRRWIFSDGRDLDCQELRVAFVMDVGGDALDWPAAPACEAEE